MEKPDKLTDFEFTDFHSADAADSHLTGSHLTDSHVALNNPCICLHDCILGDSL